MQKYENNLNILSEFLDFLKYKIDNGKLTLAEMRGLMNMFRQNVTLTGTAEEIAGYYKKSIQDVRNVVHRKMFSRPARKVHYNFEEFCKIAPEKWKEKT